MKMIILNIATLCCVIFNIPFAIGDLSEQARGDLPMNVDFWENHQKPFSWSDPNLQKLLWDGDPPDEDGHHGIDKRAIVPRRFGPAIKLLSCIGCMEKAGSLELKYWTTERFLKDIIVTPESTRDKCIFYGKRRAANMVPEGLSLIATRFACSSGRTTIWPRGRAYLPENDGLRDYYSMLEKGSHLQPIYEAGKPAYTQYFSAMSKAVAMTCLGNIFVMSDTPDNIVQNQGLGGIWWDVELPQLKERWNNGELGTLTAVDTSDFSVGYNLDWDTMQVINRVNLKREEIEDLLGSRDENGTSGGILGKRDSCSIPAQYEPPGFDFFG